MKHKKNAITKTLFSRTFTYLFPVIMLFLMVFVYFYPAFEGKTFQQEDINRYRAVSKEIGDYRNNSDKEPLWTGSLFSGMPTFQIGTVYSGNLINKIRSFIGIRLPANVNLIFYLIIGFYFLLLVLKVDPWISMIGAVAFGFSTFFLISFHVGHNSKLRVIEYIAPVIACIIYTYRGKRLLGASLTSLFIALAINANHPQILYYLCLFIAILVTIEFITALKERCLKGFLISSALLLSGAVIAVGPNAAQLWTTYTYSKESIRGGKSELHNKNEKQPASGGLDIDYAMSWSYGKMETFTLLIPHLYGGSSTEALDESSNTYAELVNKGVPEQKAKELVTHLPLYWGTQPFTAGPVYVGAIICFLFILGLFIVKDNIRWWILGGTILSIILAWGKNFPFINEFLFRHLPLYNKFRAPSMILTIACFTMPLLSVLALDRIIKNQFNYKTILPKIKMAFYITGGICLLFAIFSESIFDFSATGDEGLSAQGWPIETLRDDRASLLTYSAFRSFCYIGLAFLFIWLFIKKKFNKVLLISVIGTLIIVDLWSIDKKYLNADHFKRSRKNVDLIALTDADKEILKDKDIHYRVFDVTSNPFTNASTSYYHKSIGGYHGAKLRRYQDLIEYHLNKNNMRVLNMLNAKYFIVPDKKTGKPFATMNPNALGNSWLVKNIKWVNDANEEINALNNFNPKDEAIIDKRFKNYFGKENAINYDETSTIRLTEYKPNQLTYSANINQRKQFAVFSEIYYEGSGNDWQVYIDGKKSTHIRVNYALRGMLIPEGKHTIIFRFEPISYFLGEKISFIGSVILLSFVLIAILLEIKKNYKLPISSKKLIPTNV